jgi:methionine-rich copper-binding protein CopC
MKKILLAGLVLAWTSAAVAHSPLTSTTPEHEAIMAEAPNEIRLNFGKDIRLTRLSVTHADEKTFKLDLSGHNGFTKLYLVPFQGMGIGSYLIEWRGLGEDGHALNGTFSFTIK